MNSEWWGTVNDPIRIEDPLWGLYGNVNPGS